VAYGGDLGNRIFVLYWRCPLIRVSVIRGSTVVAFRNGFTTHAEKASILLQTVTSAALDIDISVPRHTDSQVISRQTCFPNEEKEPKKI
jgi:hypothetical protein